MMGGRLVRRVFDPVRTMMETAHEQAHRTIGDGGGGVFDA